MSAKAQVERLMNDLYDFAERLLRDYGEFHPFGGCLDTSECITHVGVNLQDEMNFSGAERVNVLVGALRSAVEQKSLLACSIVTNVSIPRGNGSKCDAVKIFLEHRDGYCAEVFFVYRLHEQGEFELLDTIAQAGEPFFFSAEGSRAG